MSEGNWDYSLEDDEFFKGLPELPETWAVFSRPESVAVDWHKTENQGRIGSCQGNDLASVLERLAFVRGVKVQLSRIFAYLATQKLDGLLGGDRGSTIAGGIKLAMEYGLPPETLTGYPSSYPGKSQRAKILTQANYDAGADYKPTSKWAVPIDHDEVLNFVGGGGGISYGCAYYGGMIPRNRVVSNYKPGGAKGGHAMAILGYDKTGNLIAVNSHGDGPYKIEPRAWRQIMSHKRTRAIGLLGTSKPQPVDWYKASPYFD